MSEFFEVMSSTVILSLDQLEHYAVFHLGLHCLQNYLLKVYFLLFILIARKCVGCTGVIFLSFLVCLSKSLTQTGRPKLQSRQCLRFLYTESMKADDDA